ncbi:tRNA pseudouridine(38-40) synthase TruA [Methanothermobacter sp. DP]|uniref:tRNA pseudouridine(38-40) synthase TruA n=1 Tax=Methanothermobacter sp. DP TaxID=2998972 RepID=UPI002AA53165|nr:tRNA pseudouridine(38-40) synthase TruA [Methanothermobacter sp. DP]
MKKIALKVAYIGTNYHGFQRQPDVPTVEGKLLDALKEAGVIRSPGESRFQIAGRTDRGVHALGNFVSFFTEEEIHVNQINDLLPPDIKVLAWASVMYPFKVRYPLERHYRYILHRGESMDIDAMNEAAEHFRGTHDFSNFSRRRDRNPIRKINDVRVSEDENSILVDVYGESFLWQMVRKMVRVLLLVSEGELSPEDVAKLLDTEERVFIDPAPPENLILMDLKYGVKIKLRHDEYAIERFRSLLEEEFRRYRDMSMVRRVMGDSLKHIRDSD